MLNHLSRYQGKSEEKKVHSFVVNPKGAFTKVGVWSKRLSPKALDKGADEIQYYVLARYFEPASLVGDILLVHEPIPILKKKKRRRGFIVQLNGEFGVHRMLPMMLPEEVHKD